jgi:hypothetical protein
MSHIIEHLKKDEIIPILTEIYENTLNKNGKILIMTPNAQSLTGPYWAYEDFTHNLIFTSGSLYYVLYMADFRDIEFIDIYATKGISFYKKIIKTIAFKLYEFYILNRNRLFSNLFHSKSENIFTYELKIIAKKV